MSCAKAFKVQPHSANLLRFTALGIGIGYGFIHHKTLVSYVEKRTERRALEHRIELMERGKLLYQGLLSKKREEEAKNFGCETTDLSSPKYNMDKHIEWLTSESPPEKDQKPKD